MILKFFKSNRNPDQIVSVIPTKEGKKVVLPNYEIKEEILYEVEVEEKERFFQVKKAEPYVPFLTFEDLQNGNIHLTSICGLNLYFSSDSNSEKLLELICKFYNKKQGMFKYSFEEYELSNKIQDFIQERKKLAKKAVFERITTVFK